MRAEDGKVAVSVARNPALATLAFLVCFTSWELVSLVARKLLDQLGLSNPPTAILLAVPVLCGSLLRLPFGVLADRFGGRRMFTITMLVSAVPAVAIGIRVTTSLADVIVFILLGLLIVWFRSLWFDPHPSLMADAPFLYQLQYLGRPYILYRRRYPPASRAGRRT